MFSNDIYRILIDKWWQCPFIYFFMSLQFVISIHKLNNSGSTIEKLFFLYNNWIRYTMNACQIIEIIVLPWPSLYSVAIIVTLWKLSAHSTVINATFRFHETSISSDMTRNDDVIQSRMAKLIHVQISVNIFYVRRPIFHIC